VKIISYLMISSAKKTSVQKVVWLVIW